MTTAERVLPSPDIAGAAPRVALLGGFGVGNLGNDASLAAVVAMVRREWPTAQVLAVCPQPYAVRRRLGLPATTVRARRPAAPWARSRPGRALLLPYRVLDVARAFRLVGTVDALVVPGTGILDDYGGEPPHGWPLTLATWFAAARLRGRGAALIGIGAGPLGSPVSRRLAHLTSRISQHTSYRDAGSRDFMASAGPAAGGPAPVVPDVALSLRPRLRRPVTSPRRVVAVPVMKYRGWHAGGPTARERAEQHVQVLAAVCLWLLHEGYGVRLVTAGADDAPATEQVAAAVRGAAPEELVSALETAEADDLDALTDLLQDATAVVATRYHSVVAALLCGQPTLSIGYAAKNAALMDAVGLGRFCQHADHVDPVLLRRQLTELLEDAANLSERVAEQVSRLRAELGAEEDRLHALLRRRPARR